MHGSNGSPSLVWWCASEVELGALHAFDDGVLCRWPETVLLDGIAKHQAQHLIPDEAAAALVAAAVDEWFMEEYG